MANVKIANANYNNVPSIKIPNQSGGGTTEFFEVSGSQTFNQNGTFDVTTLAQAIISVAGGGGGLEYETGTYTPTTDTARPSISFSKSHTDAPVLVALVDSSSASGITSSSNTLFCFFDPYKLFGNGYPYSTSATRYAVAYYSYRSSNGHSSSGVLIQHNSDNTGSSSTSYTKYWCTNTGFHPYSNSSSRYFRANRNYKWIAVWKPAS